MAWAQKSSLSDFCKMGITFATGSIYFMYVSSNKCKQALDYSGQWPGWSCRGWKPYSERKMEKRSGDEEGSSECPDHFSHSQVKSLCGPDASSRHWIRAQERENWLVKSQSWEEGPPEVEDWSGGLMPRPKENTMGRWRGGGGGVWGFRGRWSISGVLRVQMAWLWRLTWEIRPDHASFSPRGLERNYI